MKNVVLAIVVVPFLVMPAFAGSSNAGDKPLVVAETVDIAVHGDRVVGDRHRHHDEGHAHHHHHHDDRR
jgi:hypothetical protein